MPIFMIERHFVEQLGDTPPAPEAGQLKEINDSENVRWLKSYLTADKQKTFCMYEAANPEAIQRAADKAGIPADLIVEVSCELQPTGESTTLSAELLTR